MGLDFGEHMGIREGEEIIGSQPMQSARTDGVAPTPRTFADVPIGAKITVDTTAEARAQLRAAKQRTVLGLLAAAGVGGVAAYALTNNARANPAEKTSSCKGAHGMKTIYEMVKQAAEEEAAAKSEGGGGGAEKKPEGGEAKKGVGAKVKETAGKAGNAVAGAAKKVGGAVSGAAGTVADTAKKVGGAVSGAAGAVAGGAGRAASAAGDQFANWRQGANVVSNQVLGEQRMGGPGALGRVGSFLREGPKAGTDIKNLSAVGRHPILAALAATAGLGGAGYGAYRALGGGGAPAEKISSVRVTGMQKMAMLQTLTRAHQITRSR